VKVAPKEVTGNDNAVHAAISAPMGVVIGGAVKRHRMKLKPADSAIKRVGGCFALATMLLCAGKLHGSDRLFQFESTFPSNPNPAGPVQWFQTLNSQ
jgi:hypothetical protein